MSNAIFTLLLLSIPLVIVTLCSVGWLARRSTFLVTGIIIYILTASLILATLIAVGLSRGHGSTEAGGWVSMTVFYIWLAGGIILLITGYRIREPNIFLSSEDEVGSTRLKNLKEVESDKIKKIQNKT